MLRKSEEILFKNLFSINLIWVILLAIFSVFVYSCTTPRSVRPTGSHNSNQRTVIRRPYVPEDEKKDKEKKADNNVKIENSSQEQSTDQIPIGENENNIAPEPTGIAGLSNAPIQNNEEKVDESMPTLVEQLRLLNAGQIEIQKDLREIKASVNDIEGRLESLEKNKLKSSADNHLIAGKEISKPSKGDIILADEDEPDDNKIQETKADKKPEVKEKPYKINNRRSAQRKEQNTPKEEIQEPKKDNTIVNASNNNDDKINEIRQILRKQDFNEAIKKLTKMVTELKDPVTINVCNFYLGESHFGMRQFDKAVDFYEKVLDFGTSDKNDDSQIMIAEAKLRLGNVSEAKNAYQQFVKSYPKSEHMPTARRMLQQL